MVFDKIYLMMPSRMVGSVQEPWAQANGTPLYVARPSAVTESRADLLENFLSRVEHGVGNSPEKPSHKRRVPLAAPSGSCTGSVLPSALVPHRTIAVDSTPRILDGFMLATHKARSPRTPPRGMCFTQTADDLTRRLAAEIDLLNVQRIGGVRVTLDAHHRADDEVETRDVDRGVGWNRFALSAGAFFFTSTFSASNFENSTSPMDTGAPLGRLAPNGRVPKSSPACSQPFKDHLACLRNVRLQKMHRGVHSLGRGSDDDALALFGALTLHGPRRGVCEVLVRRLDGINSSSHALNVVSGHGKSDLAEKRGR